LKPVIIIAIAVVFLFVPISAYAEIYQNEEVQLQLTYPEGFEENYEFLLPTELVHIESPEFGLLVGFNPNVGNVDHEEDAEFFIETYKVILSDFKLVSSQAISVGGVSGWELSFIFKDLVSGISIHQYQVLVVNNEALYGFTFTILEEKFDVQFPIIQEIVDSIKFEIDDISSFEIPAWIKNNAGWWSDGSIDDNAFVDGIEYLIKEGIIDIPETTSSGTGTDEIPSWIKNNAGWWADGSIDDESFIQGIQYLVEQGIIRV